MNVCKVLDRTPGIEMTSWGTIHFPEERRIMEWVVNVVSGRWRSMRYGSCGPAPEGGFDEIRRGHERLIQDVSDSYPQTRLELFCKEDLSGDQVIALVLGELKQAGFPHSLPKEAAALRSRLEMCEAAAAKSKGRRRFEVE